MGTGLALGLGEQSLPGAALLRRYAPPEVRSPSSAPLNLNAKPPPFYPFHPLPFCCRGPLKRATEQVTGWQVWLGTGFSAKYACLNRGGGWGVRCWELPPCNRVLPPYRLDQKKVRGGTRYEGSVAFKIAPVRQSQACIIREISL